MQRNVGDLDGWIRVAIGVVLFLGVVAWALDYLALSLVGAGVAVLLGAILVVTGAINTCPIYTVAGVDTRND